MKPSSAESAELLGTNATWRYQVVKAGKLDKAAVAGDDPPLALPQHWQFGEFATVGEARGLLGVEADKPCNCSKVARVEKTEQVRAILATTDFAVAPGKIEVLEISARYRDGLRVAVNGIEVVRRNVSSEQGTAVRLHGPERETFFVAVAPHLLAAGTNRIVVVAIPHRSKAGPSFELSISSAVGKISRGPLVQRVTTSSAALVVETSSDLAARLTYSSPGGTVQEQTSLAARRHVFELTGLQAGQKVSYQVQAGQSTISSHFFAAPANSAVLRIGVYGDVRGGHDTHRTIASALLGHAPDLVITTGDMVLRGSDEGDWQKFFAVIAELASRVPFYPAIGNHDIGKSSEGNRLAREMFELPGKPQSDWYSVDIANVHFVFLDSNRYEDRAQLDWLDKDLAAANARAVRAIIAVVHAGPWSRGIHKGSKVARKRYVPLLVKHKVDLLLAGHDHLYQRGAQDGLRYVVSGGGGAKLYSISCGEESRDGKPCAVADGMEFIAKEHHFVVLRVTTTQLELCPLRPDESKLEPCQRWTLHKRRALSP